MSESDTMAVLETQVSLPLLYRGKVRDIYDVGDNRLLMVASDRVSAFDVILTQPIPRKGEVLTQLTAWWLDSLRGVIDHHLLSTDADEIADQVPSLRESKEVWARRSMLVHRTEPVMVECVVRGYVSGSAWKEYRTSGTLAGEPLPEGLVESQKLPDPIFSPSTKAQTGHDERISRSLASWSDWVSMRPTVCGTSPSPCTDTERPSRRSTESSLLTPNSSSGTTRTADFC
jgi:phosphoribosylaminoimidazole-succinocarboxamide synthase